MIQNRIFFSRRGREAATQVGVFLCLIMVCSLFSAAPVSAAASGQIAGKVFQDLNTNGLLDIGENGLSAWQVSLLRDGKAVQTAAANSAGDYSFNELPPGDYQVRLEIPATWAAVGEKEISVSLKSGEEVNVNFPNYQIIDDAGDDENYSPIMDISSYSVEVASPTKAELIWFTNYPATSQAVFSKNSVPAIELLAKNSNFGYSDSTAVDFNENTYHAIALDNLEPDTTYYFRIVSVPNPRQWRGAPYLLSDEHSFTTDPLPPAEEEIIKEDEKPTPIIKGTWVADGKGRVLATEFDGSNSEEPEEPEEEATTTQITTDEVIISEEIKEDEDEEKPAAVSTQCAIYIWILLILNLVAIIIVWLKNKESQSPASQKFWWIILILVLVPVIMGYPECWLTIWLLFILILIGVYLFNSKKKSDFPPLAGGGSNNPSDKSHASTPSSSSNFSVTDFQTGQNNSSDSYKPSFYQPPSTLKEEPVKPSADSDFFFKPDSADPPLNSDDINSDDNKNQSSPPPPPESQIPF